MKINNIAITTIEPEEGKLLRKVKTGAVVGKRVTLGYNYYDYGYALDKPYLEKPEDYEEVDEYEGWEEKPLIDQGKDWKVLPSCWSEKSKSSRTEAWTLPI